MGDLDGYESDTESSGSLRSRDTDDILDERYGEIYSESGREEEDGEIAGDALKEVCEVTEEEGTGFRDSVEERKDAG